MSCLALLLVFVWVFHAVSGQGKRRESSTCLPWILKVAMMGIYFTVHSIVFTIVIWRSRMLVFIMGLWLIVIWRVCGTSSKLSMNSTATLSKSSSATSLRWELCSIVWFWFKIPLESTVERPVLLHTTQCSAFSLVPDAIIRFGRLYICFFAEISGDRCPGRV